MIQPLDPRQIKPTPRFNLFKAIVWSASILVLLVIIIIGVLPLVLSTSYGNTWTLKEINKYVNGKVSADRFEMSWTKGFEIVNLEVRGAEESTLFHVDSIQSSIRLTSLIFGSKDYGKITIQNPQFFFDTNGNDPSNWTLLLGPSPEPSSQPPQSKESPLLQFLVNSKIQLEVEHGKVAIQHPNLPQVQFNEIGVSLNLGQPYGPITLSISSQANIQNEKPGSIHIQVKVENVKNTDLPNLFSNIDNLQNIQNNSSIEFKIEGIDLPNQSIEKLLALVSPEFPPLLSELIGESTHISIEGIASRHIASLNANVEGKNLKIAVNGTTNDGVFSLNSPASIECDLTSGLLQMLSARYYPEQKMLFDSGSHLSLQLSTFTVPISFIAPNFAQLQTDLLINFSPINLTFPKQNESCRIATLSVAAHNISNTFSYAVDMDSEIVFHKKTVPFSSKFVLKNLFSKQDKMAIEGITKTNNLPVVLFDPLLPPNFPLTLIIGPQLSLTLGIQYQEEHLSGDLSLHTENLNLKNLAFSLSDALTLSQPTSITYSPSPTFIKQLLQTDVVTPPTFTLNIEALQIPLDSKMLDKNTLVTAELKSSDFTLAAPFWPLEPTTMLTLSNFSLFFNGKQADKPSLKGHLSLSAPHSPNFIKLSGSETVTLDFNVALEQKNLANFSIPHFTMNLESNNLLATFGGSFINFEDISIDSSSKLQYVLSPEILAILGCSSFGGINIAEPTPFTILIDSFKLPMDNNIRKIYAKGNLYIPNLKINKGGNLVAGKLSETALNWKYSSQDESFKTSLETHFVGGQQKDPSSIYAQIEAFHFLGDKGFDLSNADLKGSVDVEALQSAFLDDILNLKGLLPQLLGQELIFKTAFKIPPKKQASLEVSLVSERVNANVALNLSNEIVLQSPNTPATIKVKLTPKSYQALNDFLNPSSKKTNSIQLTEPILLSCSIDSLKIFLSKDIRQLMGTTLLKDIQPLNSTIHAKCSFPLLSLVNTEGKQRVIVKNFVAEFGGMPIKDLLTFDIHAELNNDALEQKDSSLSLTGKMSQLFDSQNKLNLSTASIEVNTSLEKFPFGTLTTFLPMNSDIKNQLIALIGPNLNANGSLSLKELNGPFDFRYKGGESQGNIKGVFSKGALELKEALSLSLNLNKPLIDAFFAKVNPTFSEILYAPSEISMKTDQTGVHIPLIPYKPGLLEAPSTQINLNKILLANKGPILSIMRLFPNASKTSGEKVTAWFTPVKISVAKGQAQIFRFDVLLADAQHFAMWGKIDLVNEKLDMVIGIPGDTIALAYGVSNIDQEYMLQIPVKGSFGNIKVDWGRASTQLASLVARNSSSPEGQIIGGILGLIGGSNQPYPPPTFPIPWKLPKPKPQKPAESQQKESPGQAIKQLFGF